ncbi:unnamed protein product [Spirodela intermedia]|uniref:AAA+ ATPase domain-containing protein n=1 Tax=Spirodela intermedia TaxID=51605 RepID=A0A7I8KXY5_SPIIN|nr:unnamed protein product [Spirodela intermedia]
MTRPIRNEILKEDNGTISDHLRNHLHLTNCIHVKNHIHRLSPNMAERSLLRDLIMLQRSRSLRDPSTSPASWHSPPVADSFARRSEKEGGLHSGRRSLGVERWKERGRLSVSSPKIPITATSKVVAAETISDNRSVDRCRYSGTNGGEESGRKNHRRNLSGINEKPQDFPVSGKTDLEVKKILKKGTVRNSAQVKTLSEQLAETTNQTDSEDLKPPCIHRCTPQSGQTGSFKEPEVDGHVQRRGLGKPKERNFKGTRRVHEYIGSREARVLDDLSHASNSLTQGSMDSKCNSRGSEVNVNIDVTRAPKHVCGIPWNWSRIHNRGRTIIDIAGRSLSCGLTESRLRRNEGAMRPQAERDAFNMEASSDHLSSSAGSDSESLPLLVEPSRSQRGTENSFLSNDYSGELCIYANHDLNRGRNSDIGSEARSGTHHNSNRHYHGRHQSLTQKYAPKNFRDLVGQNLVVQALSNAVVRGKVGLVYVFYGPHGTGKTSCARIFARAINCKAQEHPKPCGTCISCISHNLGKSQDIMELGSIGKFELEGIFGHLEKTKMQPSSSSKYRVFIVDDCDTLSADSWNAISKVIDLAPRCVVFLLISTNLDSLPHMIISRCQKFFFPKLKDAEIIDNLQWIATREGLEIDKDALRLIASRSDGSLRDAEMTLDQLSLLGQTISLTLVQELVGLISDEKLVDLLDLALSADTVNTVKRLRDIMETGVEPLALMSQVATVITDILAGSYVFTRERLRRRFFQRQTLSKEDMEKLRHALKTLSEAEKQLRLSNDKWTWLTAALLQLAPDQQYMLPDSSAETSLKHSPLPNNIRQRDIPHTSPNVRDEMGHGQKALSGITGVENGTKVVNGGVHNGCMMKNLTGKRHSGVSSTRAPVLSADLTETSGLPDPARRQKDVQKVWSAVLEKIQVNSLKKFMLGEGKLTSVSLGVAPTVQLTFSSHLNKSKAENFREHILQAFESVLSSPVTLEIRCKSGKDTKPDYEDAYAQQVSENGCSRMKVNLEPISNRKNRRLGSETYIARISNDHVVEGDGSAQVGWLHSDSLENAKSEIMEVASSSHGLADAIDRRSGQAVKSLWTAEPSSSHNPAALFPPPERGENGEKSRRQSLVRSKVSLAHVIQQAEGCSQRSGWSRRKAISIAEKLEQENLWLEPRSRSLLCWNTSKITRGKVRRLRVRPRKPLAVLRRLACGRCLQTKSPR